ncbi:MAG: DsbA family protein [Candidatus Aenigmarchaeota archaeon]|nr:DsbA family protein [Candidatus Aenigmarchaeota archaeon]
MSHAILDLKRILMMLVILALMLSISNTYSIFNLNSAYAKQGLAGGGSVAAGAGDDSGGLREAQPSQPAAEAPSAPSAPAVTGPLDDDDPYLGPDDAKVTVVEFSDFQCPYCSAADGTYQALVDRFKSQDPTWEPAVPGLRQLAAEGKIKFVYRDFPLNSIHSYAQKAAEAAECADDHGKFWEYHDRLFESGKLDMTSLKQHAVDLGLDAAQFNECLDSGKQAGEVAKDLQDGSAAGVGGTPAFFINGKLISGARSFKVFEQAISQELNN